MGRRKAACLDRPQGDCRVGVAKGMNREIRQPRERERRVAAKVHKEREGLPLDRVAKVFWSFNVGLALPLLLAHQAGEISRHGFVTAAQLGLAPFLGQAAGHGHSGPGFINQPLDRIFQHGYGLFMS